MNRAATLTALTALLVLGGIAAPAGACACGAPAPEPGSAVDVDRETAIVRWDGDLEEIVMRLDVRSDAGSTGLVVPTPSPATVSLGDAAVFEAIAAEIEPEEFVEFDWWGLPLLGAGDGAPGGAAPEVLARVQLGPIEATTLAASDTAGLQQWLDDNGFALSEAVEAQLGPYVDEGWSFVALRLNGERPLDGALDPIRLTFASDALVYPMRMSRASDHEQLVRLFIFGDHRAEVANAGDAYSTVTHAAPVRDAELKSLGAYLTVVDLSWYDPANQIEGDLAIADAPDDTPVLQVVTRVERVEVLGFPAGPLIVGGAIVLLLVLAIVIVALQRRRRA